MTKHVPDKFASPDRTRGGRPVEVDEGSPHLSQPHLEVQEEDEDADDNEDDQQDEDVRLMKLMKMWGWWGSGGWIEPHEPL